MKVSTSRCCGEAPTERVGVRSSVADGGVDRRGFVRLAGLGAGAAALGLASSTGAVEKRVEAVLLTCMDYRLTEEALAYMKGRGLGNSYDHLVIAGASLGATVEQYPAWGETFWAHLALAIDLHGAERLIVIDHRDCGAYQVVHGSKPMATPEQEFAIHARHLRDLRQQVADRYPQLETELFLMALDGSVEAVE